MESEYTSVIQLGLIPSIGLLVLCLFLVLKGRPEIATGIYLAIGAWGHTLKIGNIAQTWILLATMFGAAVVFYKKNNDFQLPKNDRWIIPWVSFWWLWSLSMLLFSSENKGMIQPFILGTIIPIPVVLLYSQKIKCIKSFSIAYVLTTMMGGLVVLQYINANFPELMINLLTGAYGMGRLPIRNYHVFSYMFGVSVIMLIALSLLIKNLLTRVLCICAIPYFFYFLYFGNSRQTILATSIVCCLFLFWQFRKKYVEYEGVTRKGKKMGVVLFAAIIAFSGYFLYEYSPEIIFRQDLYGEYSEHAAGATRVANWSMVEKIIFDSYFFGRGGYESGNVHNIFLSAFINETILGFILLLGFLMFSLKQMRNIWSAKVINNITIWRMAFFCIFLSTMIHSQFSGDNISAPELFWSVIFLWYSNKDSNVMQSEVDQSKYIQ